MIKKILLLLFISLLSITNVKAQDVTCEYSDGIYHVIIPEGTKIEFVSKKRLMTNEEVHKELGALLSIIVSLKTRFSFSIGLSCKIPSL